MPAITVRPLTPADFALGMELKTEAGWNQLESDWQRAYDLAPDGGFVGECDGTAAATLTTALFGRVAWIAMVLTRESFRGRGLATALLKRSLAWAESRGAVSVRLDATEFGRPVYEKFGFTVDGEVSRFAGRPTTQLAESALAGLRIRPWESRDLTATAILDADATDNDRSRLLQLLHRDWPAACIVAELNGVIAGFGMARRGSRAVQIGPVVATDPAVGAALFAHCLNELDASEFFVDVPHANRAAMAFATQCGLTPKRHFFRMTRGKRVDEKSERIWANYGPEKG